MHLGVFLVRTEGLEPSRSFELRILSPVCLPFHHVRLSARRIVQAASHEAAPYGGKVREAQPGYVR